MKRKSICQLSWGLFCGKPSFRWIKDAYVWIRRVFFTLKHGYSPQLRWETFEWIDNALKEALQWYKTNRVGSPVIIDDYPGGEEGDRKVEDAWNAVLDRMIELLELMNGSNPLYDELDYAEVDAAMENAKDELFELLSKYWFCLWD